MFRFTDGVEPSEQTSTQSAEPMPTDPYPLTHHAHPAMLRYPPEIHVPTKGLWGAVTGHLGRPLYCGEHATLQKPQGTDF